MFSKEDLAELIPRVGGEYNVIRSNGHDIYLHSLLTGHDWIVMSNYADMQCIIMHRGHYASIWSALEYINQHDKSYYIHHISKKNKNSKEKDRI